MSAPIPGIPSAPNCRCEIAAFTEPAIYFTTDPPRRIVFAMGASNAPYTPPIEIDPDGAPELGESPNYTVDGYAALGVAMAAALASST